MNKYQKALSELKNSDIKLHVYNDQDNIIEEHQPTIYDFYHDEIFVLKELVEKATPKKPAFDKAFEDEETTSIYDEDGYINSTLCLCPHCGSKEIYDFEYDVKFKHCTDCGGAIDWRDRE